MAGLCKDGEPLGSLKATYLVYVYNGRLPLASQLANLTTQTEA